eukprot:CAMPEP_0172451410 /NCGR_PEP_ID=MMETSP1065-20121228/9479_1 /TAXON_ID=265537 /ORGANISM="Amphiprora paludosa, Strain CCMP125" /LENGTH=376 /DNA_ID=CAMNT_0013203365 /DNA_START=21 /DNA_END=1151 /DNA_ORIENTATION=+
MSNQQPAITPSSRPLLVFNPDAKVSYKVMHILDSFKTCRLESSDLSTSATTFTESQIQNCYVDLNFRDQTTAADRKHAFIIGSVQEPCSDYLSLWASGSSGHGRIYQDLKKAGLPESLYGQDAPHFSSITDKKRFQDWVNHPMVEGLLANRMWNSYGENLDGVDCLVFAEDLHSSLLKCIMEYNMQGGYVNWDASEMVDLLAVVGQEQQLRESHAAVDTPFEETRVAHHGQCEEYYNDELATKLVNGPEKVIYESFGYPSCCSKDHYESAHITQHGQSPDGWEMQEEVDTTDINSFSNKWTPVDIQGNDSDKDTGRMFIFSLTGVTTILLALLVRRVLRKRREAFRQARQAQQEVEQQAVAVIPYVDDIYLQAVAA